MNTKFYFLFGQLLRFAMPPAQPTQHRAFRSTRLAGWYLLQSLLQRIFILIAIIAIIQTTGYSQGQDIRIRYAQLYQEELNREYADSNESPLDSADFVNFKSLVFFPISLDFYDTATFKKTRKEKVFKMKTSTDRLPLYKKYGEVSFEIKGEKFTLNVYQNIELSKRKEYKDYLFLPFTDLTNGESSYGGGRYIDLRKPKGKKIVIDFNQAYNPYCAYSHSYSCPIPPPENFLDIKVEAGVAEGLIYKDH